MEIINSLIFIALMLFSVITISTILALILHPFYVATSVVNLTLTLAGASLCIPILGTLLPHEFAHFHFHNAISIEFAFLIMFAWFNFIASIYIAFLIQDSMGLYYLELFSKKEILPYHFKQEELNSYQANELQQEKCAICYESFSNLNSEIIIPSNMVKETIPVNFTATEKMNILSRSKICGGCLKKLQPKKNPKCPWTRKEITGVHKFTKIGTYTGEYKK
jgi:hypothetical protein